MPKHLIALLTFSFGITTVAAAVAPVQWEALTSAKHPDCTAPAPCRLIERNGTFEVKFTTIPKGTMKKLTTVAIKDLKSQTPQTFTLEEMNNIDEREFYELYRVNLRASGEQDLAVHAFNSAREGAVYYYFLYDSAQRKFVMSNGTIPKLVLDPKTKRYVSDLQSTPYDLGKDLKLSMGAPRPQAH